MPLVVSAVVIKKFELQFTKYLRSCRPKKNTSSGGIEPPHLKNCFRKMCVTFAKRALFGF